MVNTQVERTTCRVTTSCCTTQSHEGGFCYVLIEYVFSPTLNKQVPYPVLCTAKCAKAKIYDISITLSERKLSSTPFMHSAIIDIGGR